MLPDVLKTPLFLRSAYNYDTDYASDVTGLLCEDPTLAQQHFKDECDINTIVERFGLTGELPENVRMPQSGDFTSATDFQSALNLVIDAQNAFAQMPANVRTRFSNDPHNFVVFASDPENRDEARKMGLLLPEIQKTPPLEVRVVPDAVTNVTKN